MTQPYQRRLPEQQSLVMKEAMLSVNRTSDLFQFGTQPIQEASFVLGAEVPVDYLVVLLEDQPHLLVFAVVIEAEQPGQWPYRLDEGA